MKCRLSRAEWDQMKVSYAGGAGLRELARNADIPEGTVLARAKREAWTQQIAQAKLIERPELAREIAKPNAINAITPMQSAAVSLHQRGERYRERMAGISERVLPLLEEMKPAKLLSNARDIELFDRFSRRNYDLDNQPPSGGPINIAFLANPSAVQIVAKSANEPKEIEGRADLLK